MSRGEAVRTEAPRPASRRALSSARREERSSERRRPPRPRPNGPVPHGATPQPVPRAPEGLGGLHGRALPVAAPDLDDLEVAGAQLLEVSALVLVALAPNQLGLGVVRGWRGDAGELERCQVLAGEAARPPQTFRLRTCRPRPEPRPGSPGRFHPLHSGQRPQHCTSVKVVPQRPGCWSSASPTSRSSCSSSGPISDSSRSSSEVANCSGRRR